MRCPIDGAELTVTDRQGVQIDYCTQCRGVWLDRGELDKIIDAAYALPQNTAAPGQDPPAVGVWADSIDATPPAVPRPAPQKTAPPRPAPQPDPVNPAAQDAAGPSLPDFAQTFAPALSGLLAGLAANGLAQQNPRRRKPRGWLEQMFDLD